MPTYFKYILYVLGASFCIAHAENTDWSEFEWAAWSYNGKKIKKAAILLPIKIKGFRNKKLYLQLDTGLDVSTIYGVAYGSLISRKPQNFNLGVDKIFLPGVVATKKIDNFPFALNNTLGQKINRNTNQPIIGSIGLNFFDKRILVIDFPRKRYLIADKLENVPSSITASLQSTPLEYRNGKIFLTAYILGQPLDALVFDTGSSSQPIMLAKQDWEKFVQVKSIHEANHTQFSSWGNTIDCYSALLKGAISIGNFRVEKTSGYYCDFGEKEAPGDFTKWPFKINGYIGNALFYDSSIIVVNMVNHQFGITREFSNQ
jgi:hypothetical protein